MQASFPLFELYVVAFGVATVVCFGSIFRAKQIKQRDTRNGLIALLATSGAWSLLQVGYLIAPTPDLKYVFYLIGLVVGLATVGPWLYLCSAYTGRSLHHNATYQRVAAGVYLGIVGVKLTNPIHGLYFTPTMADQPFTHLMINHGILHWLGMGLAYGLAVVGIFMLFELFAQVDYDTRPFVALVGLTALPVILDILGAVSDSVVDIGYSALGVAVFAVGVLFIYTDRFETIQLAGQYDDPVIVLDDNDEIVISIGARRDCFRHSKAVLTSRLLRSVRSSQPRHGIELSTNTPTATRLSTSVQRETPSVRTTSSLAYCSC